MKLIISHLQPVILCKFVVFVIQRFWTKNNLLLLSNQMSCSITELKTCCQWSYLQMTWWLFSRDWRPKNLKNPGLQEYQNRPPPIISGVFSGRTTRTSRCFNHSWESRNNLPSGPVWELPQGRHRRAWTTENNVGGPSILFYSILLEKHSKIQTAILPLCPYYPAPLNTKRHNRTDKKKETNCTT